MIQATDEPGSIDSTLVLKQSIKKLFVDWQIDRNAQFNLLGLDLSSFQVIHAFESDLWQIENEQLERIHCLLLIQNFLHILYPNSAKQRLGWIYCEHPLLNGECPINLMTREGVQGIIKVAQLLNYLRTI